MISVICLNIGFLIACYTDVKYRKIYNVFNLSLFLLRFGIIVTQKEDLNEFLFAGFLIFIAFFIGAVSTGQMIGGDIKFGAVLGFFLGAKKALILVAVTLILNFIYRIIKKEKGITPLAPFFYAAYLLTEGLYFIYF